LVQLEQLLDAEAAELDAHPRRIGARPADLAVDLDGRGGGRHVDGQAERGARARRRVGDDEGPADADVAGVRALRPGARVFPDDGEADLHAPARPGLAPVVAPPLALVLRHRHRDDTPAPSLCQTRAAARPSPLTRAMRAAKTALASMRNRIRG